MQKNSQTEKKNYSENAFFERVKIYHETYPSTAKENTNLLLNDLRNSGIGKISIL